MEIIYSGPNAFTYRSAPSTTSYVFDPGVPQKVKQEDEEFFECMAKAPNSSWRVVTVVEKVEQVIGAVAETVKIIKKGGKR